ncbi:MAG TPA: GntR family transcriptional regulator [Acidimicrobiales bacterium]|nr:GntR family transcriptional regulator [Acidimicrobiales bacterium]
MASAGKRRTTEGPVELVRTISPLDRHSPLPLWAQLLSDLRRRLADGQFPTRFPTDAQLMADYQVSRQTVREAVRHLVNEGRVDRQRGRGSRVCQPEFEQPLGSLYSLFRVIEAQGVTQTSQVRVLEERVEPRVAERLELRPGDPLVYLARLRLAGGRPLALDQVWLPADLARPILEADFHHTALYDELATRCGLEPEGGREQLRPVVPSDAERRDLGLGPGDAALAIERLTWAGDRCLELRHTLVRGDRYGLVAQWDAPPRRPSPAALGLRLSPLAGLATSG